MTIQPLTTTDEPASRLFEHPFNLMRSLALTLFVIAFPFRALAQPEGRPNILLIVADDLGYADLGAYGSDIRTPNIDALADQGIRFTQFHTAPLCAPTRAELMTGNNNHVAGMALQWAGEPLRDNIPGYERHLSDRVVAFPQILKDAGYHTYMTGKWHLGLDADHSPNSAGFERSYGLMDGGGTHFDSKCYNADGCTYREDGVEIEYPTGRYSTELYTDRMIEFIKSNQGDGRPFLAYAAYTSPHWPLQVPDDYLDRYRGHYDDGYDALRERRFESLKSAGVIPDWSTLPPRNEAVTQWTELDDEQRRRESRKMEIYAAMVENLDFHVGRLIDYLKSANLYENTLVIFMADNGASGEDFYNKGPYVDYLRATFDNSYENMGRATSFVSYGRQWGEAGSAPFSRYKQYTREGGMVAPMIASGAGVNQRGTTSRAYVTVMDIAPTLLDVAGAAYPTTEGIKPPLGVSLGGLFAGTTETLHDDTYVTILYHNGRAFIRQGKWKLVSLEPPFSEDTFELFDVDADPGETTNRAADEPEIYDGMLKLWRSTRKEMGIVLPEDL